MKRTFYTTHATRRMGERGIAAEWVEQVLNQPDERSAQDGAGMRWRFWGKIEQYGGRSLCVVGDENSDYIEVVTAFFDRRKKL